MQNQLTFNKAQILEKLESNKKKHASDFKGAISEYWKALEEKLEKFLSLAKAKKGEKHDFFINLPVPKSYEDRYDTIIQMLEMSTDTEITLTEIEFRQFIMDEWDWKGDFAATVACYGKK